MVIFILKEREREVINEKILILITIYLQEEKNQRNCKKNYSSGLAHFSVSIK